MTAEPLTDLIARWRKQGADWQRIADDARTKPAPNHPMSQRIEARAEVYEICAAALEQWLADEQADQ